MNKKEHDEPYEDFYVIQRKVPGEMVSYLSSSPFGRWMIGPVPLVEGLVVLYDIRDVERYLNDIDGPATVIKNWGYDSQAEVAWRDQFGKVKVDAKEKGSTKPDRRIRIPGGD